MKNFALGLLCGILAAYFGVRHCPLFECCDKPCAPVFQACRCQCCDCDDETPCHIKDACKKDR